MNELLLKHNYKQWSRPNEWHKENWTIRFSSTEVEAFDDPRMNTPGKYYKCSLETVDMETLLIEIDEFLN